MIIMLFTSNFGDGDENHDGGAGGKEIQWFYLRAVALGNGWGGWSCPLSWNVSPSQISLSQKLGFFEFFMWPSRGFLQMNPCCVLHISSFQNLNQKEIEDWKGKNTKKKEIVGGNWFLGIMLFSKKEFQESGWLEIVGNLQPNGSDANMKGRERP